MDNSGFNIVISDEDDEKMVGFRLSFENGYTISVIFGENTLNPSYGRAAQCTTTSQPHINSFNISVLNMSTE